MKERHNGQFCITRDNVQVGVDGILYSKVLDPQRALLRHQRLSLCHPRNWPKPRSRSEIRKIELDRTFRRTRNINSQVVNELDKTTEPWGVKVLRYEIKSITLPKGCCWLRWAPEVRRAGKRGNPRCPKARRDAAINQAEGEKQQVIKASGKEGSNRST